MSDLAGEYFRDRAEQEDIYLPLLLNGGRERLHEVPLHVPTDISTRGSLFESEIQPAVASLLGHFTTLQQFTHSSLQALFPHAADARYPDSLKGLTLRNRATAAIRSLIPTYLRVSGYMDNFTVEVVHPSELKPRIDRQLQITQNQASNNALFPSMVTFLVRANMYQGREPVTVGSIGRFAIRGVHDRSGRLLQLLDTRPSIVFHVPQATKHIWFHAKTTPLDDHLALEGYNVAVRTASQRWELREDIRQAYNSA